MNLSITLLQNNSSVDQPWIYIILLAIGGLLFLIQFKYMFFPTWEGKIVEFEDLSADSCTSCKSTKMGRASIEVKVKTQEGEIVTAEVSPCTICLNKLHLGSSVGVSKIGTRHVAQPIIKLTKGTTW